MSSRLPVTWNRLPTASQVGTTPASATILAPLALLLLTLLLGCTGSDTTAPAESTAARLPRASNVYPPSSYTVTLVAGEGVFEDVSSRNLRGVATGDDAGSSPGWPQYTSAFVADRAGAFTVLPMPANPNGFAWRASYGYGINSCGVVVGTGWAFPGHPYTAQPMVWDPGC